MQSINIVKGYYQRRDNKLRTTNLNNYTLKIIVILFLAAGCAS